MSLISQYKEVKVLIIKRIILLSLFLTIPSVIAKESLDIVVGLERPPYIVNDQSQGYELELINHILAQFNHSANYLFVPFGRSEKMLMNDNIDAMTTTNTFMISNQSLLTTPYVVYHNVVISLDNNALMINKISDLSRHTIATFEEAHKVLGGEFNQAISKSPMYTQVSDRLAQLELLFRGRVDVIVMDINIFNYFYNLNKDQFGDIDYKIHDIFHKTHYQMAFKDHRLVAGFNQAYRHFIQTEDFIALKKKYHMLSTFQGEKKAP